MQAQELFDGTLLHLRKQRVASIQGLACMYRGKNDTMCAAGVHFSDEEYDPKMEGDGVTALAAQKTLPPRFLKHLALLSALQSAHDSNMPRSKTGSLIAWEDQMEQIAKEFNLVYTTS